MMFWDDAKISVCPLRVTMRGRVYDTHFTDGKTEVQRCQSLIYVYKAHSTWEGYTEAPQGQHLRESPKTQESR